MVDHEKRPKKPLTERVKDKLRDLVDELVGTIEGLAVPPPMPVPVRPRR